MRERRKDGLADSVVVHRLPFGDAKAGEILAPSTFCLQVEAADGSQSNLCNSRLLFLVDAAISVKAQELR